MATKKKDTGLGRSGFFEDSPPAPTTPEPQTVPEPQVTKPAKRTTIVLDNHSLDLIDQLKSHYRRHGRTVTQSELCAWGLALLAEHNSIQT